MQTSYCKNKKSLAYIHKFIAVIADSFRLLYLLSNKSQAMGDLGANLPEIYFNLQFSIENPGVR